MATSQLKTVFILGLVFVLSACAAQRQEADFNPVDLAPKIESGKLEPKVDQFLVILDASGSMNDTYNGERKVAIAKRFADRLNQTIPEMDTAGGLRTFGNTYNPFSSKSELIYGVSTPHSRAEFDRSLDIVTRAGGLSPMGRAKDQVIEDLKPFSGRKAVIVISDGAQMTRDPVEAAERLRQEFGNSLCIYPILVGDDPKGEALMNEIATLTDCGFTERADRIDSPREMGDYVETVFFAAASLPSDSDGDGVADDRDRCPATPAGVVVGADGCPLDSDGDGVTDAQDRCPATPGGVAVNMFGCPPDSDGDGVPDYLDKCPGTPKWTQVDADGCPLDSDGDGVTDDKDQCPDTPKGATVNAVGCWIVSGVQFDTGKSDIKPAMEPELDKVASVLRANPSLKIEIQGHTDSVGSAEFNRNLSEQRARAVMNYLLSHGIASYRLQSKGLGETRPIASNDTPEGRAMNRRVELKPLP